jgi:hypothetical protein
MAATQLIYQFRSRFPEFASVLDADIAMALDTGAVWLDQAKWTVRDYPLALLYFAAHYLSLQQQELASVQFGGVGESDLYLRSISIGERHVTFAQRKYITAAEKMLGPGEQMFLLTIYGQYFIQLRSRNIFPIAVV